MSNTTLNKFFVNGNAKLENLSYEVLPRSLDDKNDDLKQRKDPPFLTILQDGKICSILGKLSPGDVITM